MFVFNNELKANIETNGSFSIVFDIWTSNSETAYIGVIISFIDSDFNLNYKLIGFEEITDRHTGFNIVNCFLNIVKPYSTITFSTISRYVFIFNLFLH